MNLFVPHTTIQGNHTINFSPPSPTQRLTFPHQAPDYKDESKRYRLHHHRFTTASHLLHLWLHPRITYYQPHCWTNVHNGFQWHPLKRTRAPWINIVTVARKSFLLTALIRVWRDILPNSLARHPQSHNEMQLNVKRLWSQFIVVTELRVRSLRYVFSERNRTPLSWPVLTSLHVWQRIECE
jgi:hypothetical protein